MIPHQLHRIPGRICETRSEETRWYTPLRSLNERAFPWHLTTTWPFVSLTPKSSPLKEKTRSFKTSVTGWECEVYAGWIPSGGWTGWSTAGGDSVNIPIALCYVVLWRWPSETGWAIISTTTWSCDWHDWHSESRLDQAHISCIIKQQELLQGKTSPRAQLFRSILREVYKQD